MFSVFFSWKSVFFFRFFQILFFLFFLFVLFLVFLVSCFLVHDGGLLKGVFASSPTLYSGCKLAFGSFYCICALVLWFH